MNAEPAQMVPASGWTGGRMLGVDVFGGVCPPERIWPRMPTFFRHLDAILPWVGLETVTCKALRSGCC
jgi:hypothetical protein